MSSLVSQLVLTHLQFCNNSTTTQLASYMVHRSTILSRKPDPLIRSTAPIALSIIYALSIDTPRDNNYTERKGSGLRD